ncbi:MAG: hypothetical protein WBE90_19845 [Xanthobacteraceae bacterium]
MTRYTHLVQNIQVPLDFDAASAEVIFGSVAEAREWTQALRGRAAMTSGIDRVEIQAALARALILGGIIGNVARKLAAHLLRIQTGREVEGNFI